jgi:hypothetical protein
MRSVILSATYRLLQPRLQSRLLQLRIAVLWPGAARTAYPLKGFTDGRINRAFWFEGVGAGQRPTAANSFRVGRNTISNTICTACLTSLRGPHEQPIVMKGSGSIHLGHRALIAPESAAERRAHVSIQCQEPHVSVSIRHLNIHAARPSPELVSSGSVHCPTGADGNRHARTFAGMRKR